MSEHKYAVYADDILFYVQQPLISLPNLMSAFTEFGAISNFKINLSKSEILNISIPHMTALRLQPSFPFHWQPIALKYLGIYLTPNPASLFHRNYIPLNTIRTDLQKWTQMAHSWFGKISTVKINILPRLLFLFQMIPYKIPIWFF